MTTIHTVDESSGQAVLVVAVLSGDLETQIVLNLTTSDDSAVGKWYTVGKPCQTVVKVVHNNLLLFTAPGDYTHQDIQITFGPMSQSAAVRIPIVDDTLDEDSMERFTVSLILDTDNPRVTVSPDLAEVRIIDNDGK